MLESLRDDLKREKQKVSEVTKLQKGAKDQISELSKQISKLTQACAEGKELEGELRSTVETLEKEISGLQNKYKESKEKLVEGGGKTKLEKEISNLKTKLEQSSNSLKKEKSKVSELNKTLREYQERNSELTRRNSQISLEFEESEREWKRKAGDLVEEISVLQKEKERLEVDKLNEEKLSKTQDETRRLLLELSKVKRKFSELQHENERLSKEVEGLVMLEKVVEELKEKGNQLDSDNRRLASHVSKQATTIEGLRMELENTKAFSFFTSALLEPKCRQGENNILVYTFTLKNPKAPEPRLKFEIVDVETDGMVQFTPLDGTLDPEVTPDFLKNEIFVEKAHLPLFLAYAVIELAKASPE
eukprot:TRINITY_DN3129_c0_g1_i2.p1 TRINITY_DN3129_c0_g1~~TRINITY_DN3129_c0_g1_i2.p1  ORF type:complete len:361 (-),score=126.80 TRINITY_DN3129_c0_g1_i2:362-1444(-)